MKSAVSSRRLSGVNESELHCHRDSGLLQPRVTFSFMNTSRFSEPLS